MRPPRADIAAPELPRRLRWVGRPPPGMPALTARGPVLVHFFDHAQLNSVRALPYLVAWRERYEPLGLAVIGVHVPRFPLEESAATLAGALERLGVTHPVADDSARVLWHAYGCEGWPSLFLWSKGGALAWFHFGEGEYRQTEEAIQAELAAGGAIEPLPAPLAPLRPTDAPGVLVAAPSPEVLPGGSFEHAWSAGDGELEVEYAAAGAHATADGRGLLEVALDGASDRRVEVPGAGLYPLAEHQRHETHTLRVRASPGVRIWSLSFAAGLPPGG